MADNRYPVVPETDFGRPEEHIRRIVQASRQLQNGRGNNHWSVTLGVGTTTTTIFVTNANINSAVQLSPMSATAATSFGAGLVWADAIDGSIVIRHDSSAVVDRKFAVLLNG